MASLSSKIISAVVRHLDFLARAALHDTQLGSISAPTVSICPFHLLLLSNISRLMVPNISCACGPPVSPIRLTTAFLLRLPGRPSCLPSLHTLIQQLPQASILHVSLNKSEARLFSQNSPIDKQKNVCICAFSWHKPLLLTWGKCVREHKTYIYINVRT